MKKSSSLAKMQSSILNENELCIETNTKHQERSSQRNRNQSNNLKHQLSSKREGSSQRSQKQQCTQQDQPDFEHIQLTSSQLSQQIQKQNSRNSPQNFRKSSLSASQKSKRQDFGDKQLKDGLFESNQKYNGSNMLRNSASSAAFCTPSLGSSLVSTNLRQKQQSTLQQLQILQVQEEQQLKTQRNSAAPYISRHQASSSYLQQQQNNNNNNHAYQPYQSVREILFQNSQRRSTERQNINYENKLLLKCFKRFKQYVKLKLRVRIFLSDEIANLNLEFQKLQEENIKLHVQCKEQAKKLESNSVLQYSQQPRNFVLAKVLTKVFETNKKFHQSNFLKEFKSLKIKEKSLKQLFYRHDIKTKLRSLLKWKTLTFEGNLSRSPNLMRSSIFQKPPKHQQSIIQTELSTCPNSNVKVFQKSGFLSKSKSTQRLQSNGSNENTQFIQDSSSLNMTPQQLDLKIRQNSQNDYSKASSQLRDRSTNSDKSCVTTTNQQNIQSLTNSQLRQTRSSFTSNDRTTGSQERLSVLSNGTQNTQISVLDKQKNRLFDSKMLQKLQRIQILDRETSKERKDSQIQKIHSVKEKVFINSNIKQSIKFDKGVGNLKNPIQSKQNSQQNIQAVISKLNNAPNSNNISSSGFMISNGETVMSNKTFEPTDFDFSSTQFILNNHTTNPQNFSISEYNMESMICQMKNAPSINPNFDKNQVQIQEFKIDGNNTKPDKFKDQLFTPEFSQHTRKQSMKGVNTDYQLRRENAPIQEKENFNHQNILNKFKNNKQKAQQQAKVIDMDFLTSDESTQIQFKKPQTFRHYQVKDSQSSLISSDSSAQFILTKHTQLKTKRLY